MSQPAQAADDSQSHWTQATSTSGNVYHVAGFPITVCSLDVNWTVDDTSHNTSPDFEAKTGIKHYTLSRQTGLFKISDYRLDFVTSQAINYEFTDASPDTYTKHVWDTDTTHSIAFNSSNPTIVHIRGYYFKNDHPDPK